MESGPFFKSLLQDRTVFAQFSLKQHTFLCILINLINLLCELLFVIISNNFLLSSVLDQTPVWLFSHVCSCCHYLSEIYSFQLHPSISFITMGKMHRLWWSHSQVLCVFLLQSRCWIPDQCRENWHGSRARRKEGWVHTISLSLFLQLHLISIHTYSSSTISYV